MLLRVGRAVVARSAFKVARPASSLASASVVQQRHGFPSLAPIPTRRTLCSQSADAVAEELSDLYSDAKELMEDAEESLGTVYFEDDMNDAREAIEELLERFAEARQTLPPAEAKQMVQMVGLKMEELKSRLDVMQENLIHDDD